MYLRMNIEISCKDHCDSFSHFLYLVSYTEQQMSHLKNLFFRLKAISNHVKRLIKSLKRHYDV